MIHGELSEIDAILTTPNLEVMKILNGGLLWRKHQDYIFLIIFSNHHCHMGICPEIEIRTCLVVYYVVISDGSDRVIPENLGFEFWRFCGEMGLRQVEQGFSSLLAKFLAYLMIFQGGAHKRGAAKL